MDLCNSSYQSASFIYRNLGGGNFQRTTIPLPPSSLVLWVDYDNDGFLDLLLGQWFSTRGCALFRNNGNGSFMQITNGPIVTVVPPAGVHSYSGNWFDYDNDGALDLFVANGNDFGNLAVANFLYHNDGNTNAWLKVKLVGALSNRDAVGAKVRVQANYGGASRWQRREIAAGDSFSGNNSPIAHFGLGGATHVETLRVEWPSGAVTELHNVAVRQSLTITEAPGLRTLGFGQGAMQLQVTAHPGMNTALSHSSNLVQWTPWQTVPQTNRTTIVTDPDASQHPIRFYKARVQ